MSSDPQEPEPTHSPTDSGSPASEAAVGSPPATVETAAPVVIQHQAAPEPPATGAALSTDTPPAPAAADSTTEAQAAKRIKIGSQRSDSPPPKAPPRVKTVFKTPEPGSAQGGQQRRPPRNDRPRRDQGPNEQGGKPAPQRQQPAPPAEAATGDASVAAASTPTQPAPESSPASGESLTPRPTPLEPGKNVRKLPSFAPSSSSKVALPNLRQDLPADLAQELDEALGDMSVDDLLTSENKTDQSAPAVGVEIEAESKQRGAVLRVSRDDVFVELPGQNQGVVPLHQFTESPEVGAILETLVTRFNAEDGLYELTLPHAAVNVEDWCQVAEGMVVDAHVTGHNKGGLECQVNKLRGFIPASQISTFRVEQLEQFVGQTFPCVVTEVNAERRNLVLSRRAMLEREQAEAKEKLLAELAPGQIREGIVRTLREFGAFVDLGGVDGLLHVSQISWDRIKHPSDLLQVGQKVRVKVEKIDPQTHKISLNLRDFVENPWANVTSKYPVTSRVKGAVSKITEFGAFVRLEGGVEGLIHISEIAHQRVHRVSDFLAEGQEVEVKVLSVDPEAQRIGLSLKALMAKPEPVKKADAEPEPEPEPPPPPKSKRKEPLKGGLGRVGDGAQFGLKW